MKAIFIAGIVGALGTALGLFWLKSSDGIGDVMFFFGLATIACGIFLAVRMLGKFDWRDAMR